MRSFHSLFKAIREDEKSKFINYVWKRFILWGADLHLNLNKKFCSAGYKHKELHY